MSLTCLLACLLAGQVSLDALPTGEKDCFVLVIQDKKSTVPTFSIPSMDSIKKSKIIPYIGVLIAIAGVTAAVYSKYRISNGDESEVNKIQEKAVQILKTVEFYYTEFLLNATTQSEDNFANLNTVTTMCIQSGMFPTLNQFITHVDVHFEDLSIDQLNKMVIRLIQNIKSNLQAEEVLNESDISEFSVYLETIKKNLTMIHTWVKEKEKQTNGHVLKKPILLLEAQQISKTLKRELTFKKLLKDE